MGPGRTRAARTALALAGVLAAALVAAPGRGPGRPRRPRVLTARSPPSSAPSSFPSPRSAPAETEIGRGRRSSRRAARAPFATARAAADDCRPVRAIFYAASDWLRLATKLAQGGSPCAQYFISIPPLTADKTRPRGDQAWRIRALGPRFHALAEIHLATWAQWVERERRDVARRRRRGAAADGGGRLRRRVRATRGR